MKSRMNKSLVGLLTASVVLSSSLFAGNEDRIGSAGASHVLINPWARGSAIGDAGVANMNGIEATFTNVAGLAFTDKTQIKLMSVIFSEKPTLTKVKTMIYQKIKEDVQEYNIEL